MLRVLAAIVALLPWRALPRAGAALGFLAGSVLRIRRRVVQGAMARAGVAAPAAQARAMYARLGAGLFELLWLAGASRSRRDDALAHHVSIEPPLHDEIARALEAGPVVFAASHTGNWELAAAAAASLMRAHGRALAVVVKPLSVRSVNAFCTRLRQQLGISLVAPRGALSAAREALARGDAVAMMIDQVPDRARHGARCSFLGAEAFADRAPAALARAAGATLIVVGAERSGSDNVVRLLASIAATAGPPARVTAQATAALDAFVRRTPADWLWLHRRWRAPRERVAERRLAGGASGTARLVARYHPG